MDISFLSNYFILIVVGICLCLGYIIKESLSFIQNKYIPLIMAIVGVAINIWVAGYINAEILLGGMFSGLASTGFYELFKNFIEKAEK